VVGFAEQRCFGLNIAHGAHNNNGSGHAASQGKRGRLASPTLLYSCRNRDTWCACFPWSIYLSGNALDKVQS